jgi:hypothetical protein
MLRVNIRDAAKLMGRKGGIASKADGPSEAQKRASKANGAKGGRPKEKKPSAAALAKRRSRTRLLRG